MEITLTVTPAQQAELDRLRGTLTAQDFAGRCFDAGLKLADIQSKQKQQPVHFASTQPEFKTLDDAAIKEALKDPKNPVTVEVGRLVTAYMTGFQDLIRRNGNKLPEKMQVATQVPIEILAFQITAEAVKATMQKVAGASKK